jgi:hypothetical protein
MRLFLQRAFVVQRQLSRLVLPQHVHTINQVIRYSVLRIQALYKS